MFVPHTKGEHGEHCGHDGHFVHDGQVEDDNADGEKPPVGLEASNVGSKATKPSLQSSWSS